MRKVRFIMLLAALICTGVACKKDESSLNLEKNELSVAADERAQVIAEFENATGLTQTTQTPINAGSPLEFNTVQEAVNYVNSLFSGQTQLANPDLLSLPVPEEEDDQICYTCRTVRVIGNIPLHASILIGYLRFKRLGPELQYSFISDTWMLAGVHLGLDSSRPIWINFSSATKFRFSKLFEYYLGFRLKGFDVTYSVPFRASGAGDVNDISIGGTITPP